MNRLWQLIKTMPMPQLVLLGLGIVVVLALVGGGVGVFVSHRKDAKLDKVQAERQAQIDAVTTERDEAIGKAKAWETRAKELEAQVAITETIIRAQGARVEAAKEKLEEESKRYEEELQSVDDGADTCTRLLRICERAKSLGLYPKAKACECE